MISQESAQAYKEAAKNGYEKEYDILGPDHFEQAIGFDGSILDIEDSVKGIMQSVKDQEDIQAFRVPSYQGIPRHLLVISDEGIIRLYFKS